jgi:hypothetical protein
MGNREGLVRTPAPPSQICADLIKGRRFGWIIYSGKLRVFVGLWYRVRGVWWRSGAVQ